MSDPQLCVKTEMEDPGEEEQSEKEEDNIHTKLSVSEHAEKKAKKRKKHKKHKSNKKKKKSKCERYEVQHETPEAEGNDDDRTENIVCTLDESVYLQEDFTTKKQKKKQKRKNRGKSFPCIHCGVRLPTFEELQQHSLEHESPGHNNEKPHQCNVCERSFARRVHLMRHKRCAHASVHNAERPWRCERCPVAFLTRAELDRHTVRHEGARPHLCTVCRMEFATSEELLAHTSSSRHTPGRALCRYCGVLFESRHERAAHINSAHTDEDSLYKCEQCSTIVSCPHRPLTSDEDQTDSEDEEYNPDPLDLEHSMDEADFDFVDQLNREKVDFDLQYVIVNKMFKGRIVTDICREYNLSQDIVNEIWDRRENILDVSIGNRMDRETVRKLDKKLIDWYNGRRAQNEPVTGKLMIEKADEFAHEFGNTNFSSNIKWIDRFKKRHNISLRSVPVKREPYVGPFGKKVKDSFLLELWPELRVGFTDEDIFTADEIGVFYNTSSGRILKKMGKKYIHGQPRDRLAIFMCTNLTGNEKKKLLVCGVEDPLKGSSRALYSLPVRYVRNKYGHFTTATFEEEIRKWDAQLERDNRRALLILDRASIHTKMLTLNLKLVFVPWKASTVLMPIKNGISAAFREEYRKLMLLAKVQNVIRGMDRRLTCLEGLEMIGKAWSRVSNDLIMKSFAAAGFEAINKYPKLDYKISPSYTLNDHMLMSKWLSDYDVDTFYTDLSKLDSYLTVDEDLLTDLGTHCSVFGGNRKAKEIVYPEKQYEEDGLPIGTDQRNDDKESILNKMRAMQDMEIVRQYLESSDTSYDVFNSFAEVEKFLVRNPLRTTPNTTDLIKQED